MTFRHSRFKYKNLNFVPILSTFIFSVLLDRNDLSVNREQTYSVVHSTQPQQLLFA